MVDIFKASTILFPTTCFIENTMLIIMLTVINDAKENYVFVITIYNK